MKKIDLESFSKKDGLGLLVILGLLIHLYLHSNLIFQKVQNPNLFDILNNFLVLITLSTIVFFIYSIFFWILTKDAFSVEKWALRNLTRVCYFIVIMLGISFIQKYLTTEQFLTSTGATIVFWYGYRKYERDKEIEMIARYSDRYNLIINSLSQNKKSGELILAYRDLVNLWSEEFFLSKQNYISQELWNEWSEYIKQDIFSILLDEFNSIEDTFGKSKTFSELDFLDNSYFLLSFMQYFHIQKDENFRKLKQSEYFEFILNHINDVYSILMKFKVNEKQKILLNSFNKLLILMNN